MTKEMMKVIQTTKKWWVLSRAHHDFGMGQGHEISYSEVLAVCKTKKEAENLLDQNKKFKGASIDHVPEYHNPYSFRGC